MSLRLILLTCLLWSGSYIQGFGQILADFTFDDTSDMPASLKKNAVGPDGLSIHPNARSDGEGVYTLPDPANSLDQNIDLEISEDLLNHTESIYLEFDFRPQDDFCWFIFSGYRQGLDLFRFGHANVPDNAGQQGFHIRYATKKDPSNLISSGYVGTPVTIGERALIGFMYDAVSGTAYIFKNGNIIWQTPDAQKSPGFGFHWQTAAGSLTVGANMKGNGSTTPSLYRFRAFENTCVDVFPPIAKSDTICGQGAVRLKASGGADGNYRWYSGEEGNMTLINDEVNHIFETPALSESTTFYVAVASEFCETAPVPVKAVVQQEPGKPRVSFTPACGSGEVSIYLEEQQEEVDYWWYSAENSDAVQQNDSLSISFLQDTVVYVKAVKGICESEVLPVYIHRQALPTIDAGPNQTILKGESTSLFASGNFLSCRWTGSKEVEGSESPSIEVSPEVTQNYIVTATNENGCEQADTVTVFVINKFPVPNAFSPNDDGRNDSWEIPNIEKYPECRIAVFNRWGNEIFSSTGYKEAWDGTHNGEPLPLGTYYYTLQLSPEHNPVKGAVAIFK